MSTRLIVLFGLVAAIAAGGCESSSGGGAGGSGGSSGASGSWGGAGSGGSAGMAGSGYARSNGGMETLIDVGYDKFFCRRSHNESDESWTGRASCADCRESGSEPPKRLQFRRVLYVLPRGSVIRERPRDTTIHSRRGSAEVAMLP